MGKLAPLAYTRANRQNEVLHSPPVNLLPKNPLHAPSHNPAFQDQDDDTDGASSSTAYIAHHLLPNPSPTHPLHRPDQRFYESEQFTDKFHQHFQGTMEKVNRRVTKRWSEHATDMSELGAQWNGFSLSEKGELATAIEKVGQAVDTDYLATTEMLKEWEVNVTEPTHTYTQFAQLIRSRLSFRHQKHVQYELVQEALDTQRDKLELLEAAERESRRLEDALERGGSFHQSGPTTPSKTPGAGEDEAPAAGAGAAPAGSNLSPPSSPRSAPRRQGNSFGLLSAVKHSLSGMMDVDPEATRRANIGKTRDNISQVSAGVGSLAFSCFAVANSSSRTLSRPRPRTSNTRRRLSKPTWTASRDRRLPISNPWQSSSRQSTANGAGRILRHGRRLRRRYGRSQIILTRSPRPRLPMLDHRGRRMSPA